MIDMHTHVLPYIDDGSTSIEETSQMLNLMKDKGIKKVVATPHFYSEIQNIDEFLEKREEAYKSILDVIPKGMEINLGAEVRLSYNIHKLDLKKLAIAGTDHILIEMPYVPWDPWVYDELFKISAKHVLDIVIAHVDRYYGVVKKDSIQDLLDMNFKYQVNLDDLKSGIIKSPAIKLLKRGIANFIGSDCHNMTTRVPILATKTDEIRKKLGNEMFDKCMKNAEQMFSGM